MITDTLLDTTASVCRILSRNESHILLAGPTGSCKIDAIYISCTFLGVKLLSITPLKNYNINDFYNDLKMVKLFAHSFHPLVLRGFSLKQFIAFGELLPFGFAPVLSKVRRKITPCVCVCMVSFTQCITKSILMIFIGDAIGCIR